MATNTMPFFDVFRTSLLRAATGEFVFAFDTGGCAVMGMAGVYKALPIIM